MSEMLTLVGDPDRAAGARIVAPVGYIVRPAGTTDIDALGRLYFESYDPGVAWPTLEEATTDIRASFEGDYGELLERASPVATHRGEFAAAVLTVERAPWDDTPDCPFIIETFTARSHRRRGLARTLVSIAAAEGEGRIALRVAADNTAARRLYRSLGFRPWSG